MTLTAIDPITNSEFLSLETNLANNFAFRYHYRNGVKRNVLYFCVGWVKPDNRGIVFGHLSGINGLEAKFNIRRGKLNPIYEIDPRGSGASLDILETEIKHSAWNLFQRTLNVNTQESFNTENWKGYYLYRKNRAPGLMGRKNMQKAIEEGFISTDFKNTCFEIGIHMKHFA
jgi:hypothetical protein